MRLAVRDREQVILELREQLDGIREQEGFLQVVNSQATLLEELMKRGR
jgi:hypothetical protein